MHSYDHIISKVFQKKNYICYLIEIVLCRLQFKSKNNHINYAYQGQWAN